MNLAMLRFGVRGRWGLDGGHVRNRREEGTCWFASWRGLAAVVWLLGATLASGCVVNPVPTPEAPLLGPSGVVDSVAGSSSSGSGTSSGTSSGSQDRSGANDDSQSTKTDSGATPNNGADGEGVGFSDAATPDTDSPDSLLDDSAG